MDFQTFKATPKAELHVHLEGSLTTARALQLAAEQDHPWSGLTPEALKTRVTAGTFETFIQQFMSGYQLLKTASHFQAVTEDLLAQFEAQGVTCAEVLYSPGVYVQHLGRDLKAIHDGIEAGLAHARIPVRFILDTVINMGYEFMRNTLEMVLADRREFLAGFSVGGGVPDLDMTSFVPLFHQASDWGLGLLAHAGEVDSARNIEILLRQTDVRRIAHGCAAAASPATLNLLRERDVAVDVCLTSNLCTGVVSAPVDHPLKTFLAHGVPVSLSTDDPFYFGVDLFQEHQNAATWFDLTDEDLHCFMANSLKYRL